MSQWKSHRVKSSMLPIRHTVYPIKYMHSLVVHCFVVVTSSFSVNSYNTFTHTLQGYLHWHWGNHTIAPVPVKQPWRIWAKSINYLTTTKQTKSGWIFFGMYCLFPHLVSQAHQNMQHTTQHNTNKTNTTRHWETTHGVWMWVQWDHFHHLQNIKRHYRAWH